MPRRLERTISTFIIGAGVLVLFVHAFFGDRLTWFAGSVPVMQAAIAPAERVLSVNAPVFAADGTLVGKVSGLSRDTRGHVERVRVTETIQTGSRQRIFIIHDRYFIPAEGAVQLKLSVPELDTMPQAMTEDTAGS